MRIIVISDIFGCYRTFNALLEQVDLRKTDQLVLLGNIIDKGPRSGQLLDKIDELQRNDYFIFCIRGLQEHLMSQAIMDPTAGDLWLSSGGYATLHSLGVKRIEDIPQQYFKFVYGLPFFLTDEQNHLIYTSSGINFNEEDPLADFMSMLTINDWYDTINPSWLDDYTILHGNQASSESDIIENWKNCYMLGYMCVDNGVLYKSTKEMGQLCALDIITGQLFFQQNIDY